MKRALAILAVASIALTACGESEGSDGAGPTTTAAPSSTTEVQRPDGPAADLSEELTVGTPFLADVVNGIELPEGWTETEYVGAGTARRYTAEGDLPADGSYDLTESTEDPADYRTRVAVRMPPADAFNGTVVVEWLNVSSGLDANPDFIMGYEELYRGGYAWVGVSAQEIGVEGGDVAVKVDAAGDFAGKGLKGIDPERYGSLAHPGDAYSYDMYTQVGRAVRENLAAERVLAIGESQSAFALTTYANGVQPLTKAFDGFLIHSRGAAGLGLGEPGEAMDIAGAIGQQVTTIRTDLDVRVRDRPVLHHQLLPGPPGRHRPDPAVGDRRHRPCR